MSRFSDTNRLESQLVKVDYDLMMRLLKNNSFIVSDEYKLYAFLKKWMLVDLEKKNQQHHYENIGSQEYFLNTVAGQQYKPLFDLIRFENLIDYSDEVELIRQDKIFNNKQINSTAFKILQTILDLKDQRFQR